MLEYPMWFIIGLFLLRLHATTTPPLCPEYLQNPKEQWKLPGEWLNEASGISRSMSHTERTYHVNDSDEALHIITFSPPGPAERWMVSKTKAYDLEDLSVGPCPHLNEKNCLILADTGDNRRKRKIVRLRFIPEPSLEKMKTWEGAEHEIILTFPEGSRDVEAVAMDPLSLDLFLVSKHFELLSPLTSGVPEVFRLERKNQRRSRANLERIGVFDVKTLFPEASVLGTLPTSLDFHPSGQKALVLTYESLIELDADFFRKPDKLKLERGVNIKSYPLAKGLPQAEAASYSLDGKRIWVTSESMLFMSSGLAPLQLYQCKQ